MWGICLDSGSIQEGLFQMVIQYEISEEGEVAIILPETAYRPYIKHIKKLPISSPKYIYGESVYPCNHSNLLGEICSIRWHFKLNCCFYAIKVDGKIKSKRYFDNDLDTVM